MRFPLRAVFAFLLSVSFTTTPLFAQNHHFQRPADAASIHRNIEKLGVLGTVMYVAAHPDDENTRLISWFSRQRLTHTVYLSLTRGDGGQNLIGTEMSELLGVLRTQELLGARRIDGGEQWFTRANDFGYSKTAEETMAIWNKDAVLADVVWAIRKFRPDILVNRFNAENSGSTHGHHTASAMLALEAFDLAGDPKAFPEQLKYVQPWQPRRIFFNTSWWFYGSQEAFDAADKSRMAQIDIGVYEPWSGFSNSEIAMKSRSMHQCQGFGSELTRGTTMDYMNLLKGDLPPDLNDPLSGIDMSWQRISGGATIQKQIQAISDNYDFRNPASSLPALIDLHKRISQSQDHPWKTRKLEELTRVITDCAGLFAEAKTSQTAIGRGDTLTFNVEVTQRAGATFTLLGIRSAAIRLDTAFSNPLVINTPWKTLVAHQLPKEVSYTAPYWLTQPAQGGLYSVDEQTLRGRPESPSPTEITLILGLEDQRFSVTLPVTHKEVDPAFGERYQPLQVLPAGFITPVQPVAFFPTNAARSIQLRVKAGRDNLEGEVIIHLPEGWRAEPVSQRVAIKLQGDELEVQFNVFPPVDADVTEATFTLASKSQTFPFALHEVKYDHIPHQAVLMPSSMRLVHINLAIAGKSVGYIAGAGDQIPECLRDAGYDVTILDDAAITKDNLRHFDAVITGIRAYNTRDALKFRQEDLKAYVEQGGTLIVQYNTPRGLVTNPSPLPLKISRERVTDETATMRLLAPDHPAIKTPNEIRPADFEGWVQERGLYFAEEWDPAFIPLIASADPGEKETMGMLVTAPYGKGHYVYTGISFFRQLPAGVPGAYRLLANLIALGQTDRP
jgi:LmbE family N-acetylglucosaminyl deacetylase